VTDDELTSADDILTQAAADYAAWSAEEPETQPMRQSWGMTWGRAAIMIFCAAMVAFAIGLAGWLAFNRDVPTLPPVAYVSPPSVTFTPTAAPPAPATTVTVTEPPVARPPSPAELDARFLASITDAGLRITDARAAIAGGRELCRYLAAGHTEADAVSLALHNNSSLAPNEARIIVVTAVRVYCPDLSD
jgi:hypothetical protein